MKFDISDDVFHVLDDTPVAFSVELWYCDAELSRPVNVSSIAILRGKNSINMMVNIIRDFINALIQIHLHFVDFLLGLQDHL